MKRKSYYFLLLCFLAGFVSNATAQNRTVSGTVQSKGQPMPGVTVVVKGSTVGTSTDRNGKFTLPLPNSAKNLVFSFIGYITQEIEIGTQNTINVTMEEDVQKLNEIVITGQGVGISKKRISTTVSTITEAELKAVPAVQLDQLIQSKLPNAQIKMSSGQPGTASIIRSRGPVSAISNTTPVIFVDGIRVDNLNSNPSLGIATGGAQSSAISDIPMEDIERIEFIPGGAATTLYGADAANGVLQIFTKRGTTGYSSVNIETQIGSIRGTEDFLRYKRTAEANFEPGLMQSYRFGFNGGNKTTSYSFSGNVYQDDSFNDLNETVRRNFRTTVSTEVNRRLTYSFSLGFSNNEFTRDYNANTSYARFGNLEGGAYGDLDSMSNQEFDSLKLVLKQQGEATNITEKINRFSVSNNFKYLVSEKITANFDIGIDSRNSTQREVLTNQLRITKGDAAPGTTNRGQITNSAREFNVVSANINTQYVENWKMFNFITTVGGQFFRSNDVQNRIIANNVVDGSISINNSASQQATDFYRIVTSYGLYIAENLGIANKVYLDLGLRFDGNSAFGSEIGLIALPKIGASYVLSDEKWFTENIAPKFISLVKFRANYGQSSVFPTAFANQTTFAAPSYLGGLSFAFANPGNPNLKSEIATTTEFGADLGFYNGRITLAATYYNSVTNGALFTPPAIPSSGQQAQLDNIGEISNKGVELAFRWNVIKKKDHNLDFALSYNYNENLVESTGGAPEFVVGGFTFLGSFIKAGQPLGYLRGSSSIMGPDGNPVITPNAFLGTTFSPVFGNFNLTYNYKGKFSLFVNGDYQRGGQGVNVDDVLRFFGGVNDEGRLPQDLVDAGLTFFDLASYWVEDANYIKVRNITLSYNFGNVWDDKIKKFEVAFSFVNPFNFVSSSFDPDATGAGIAAQGGFAGGGFGFGTESAPRMYIGTVRFGL